MSVNKAGAVFGVDTGGTFTDIVGLDGSGRIIVRKVDNRAVNVSQSIAEGVASLVNDASIPPESVSKVVHCTTILGNSVIERKGPVCGLITTEGFRDVLELGRQHNPPRIQGDRVQLQQVILNLIVNAIEAMSGVSEGARELSISTEINASNDALVAVRDSGPGLDPTSLEHLFDAFYTTKSSGMGMGLSICRSIIEAHKGRIWAEANVPQGATFQFTLPWQAAS